MENALNSSYYMTERRIVMIIDFHTHIFPEKIASRAIASLEQKAKMRAHVSGVEASLRASMDKSGVDLSIILPVVTNPHQFETVNRVAVETNEHTKETGLLSFGGIHPDNDNYREIIQFLADHGCKGIKIHPVYQGVAIDDIRFLRIIDCAEEYGLVTITHAGYDIGFPGEEQSLPVHICNMLDEIKPSRMVLAHMGGWGCWDQVMDRIIGRDVSLDTAFSTTSAPREGAPLSTDLFTVMIQKHGADRIVMGSDSPWSDQLDSINAIKNCNIPEESIAKILGDNAKKLLQL